MKGTALAQRTLTQRFWSKVTAGDAAACWLWTGATARGYGKLGMGRGTTLYAHRVSYELHRGSIPDGQLICHRCDTPLCVNPAHLFLGTNTDNLRDMTAKGRHGRPLAQRAACKNGHAFTRENTRMVRGARICRECSRAASQRQRAKRGEDS